MDKALYDRGMAMRRKVLGDEYVDRAIANTDDFNRKFQDLSFLELSRLARLTDSREVGN